MVNGVLAAARFFYAGNNSFIFMGGPTQITVRGERPERDKIPPPPAKLGLA